MGIKDWWNTLIRKEEEVPEPMSYCDNCGYEVPQMALIASGAQLLCSGCHQKKKKDLADLEFKKKQARALEKKKYHCYNCKFNFSRKKEFYVGVCPNCGSENFVQDKDLL